MMMMHNVSGGVSEPSRYQMGTKTINDGDWESIVGTFNQKQEEHIQSELSQFKDWMLKCGKDPEEGASFAESTANNYFARVKHYFKYLWQEEGYTTTIPHSFADRIAEELNEDDLKKQNGNPYDAESKRKDINSLECYFQWQDDERSGEEWESPYSFGENNHSSPTDFFVKEERQRLRDASFEYKSVPKYKNLSPEERDRWKGYIAQVRGKPKDDVSPDDWEYLNTNYKWVSLIWTSLDAGLRPCEVERAKVSWFRESKKTLQIPKDDAAKNRDDWELALRDETVRFLKKWKEQRKNIEKYDETDALWLNRLGNPYNSSTLNYHLRKLLQDIELTDPNRDLTWYSIRHSTATYLNQEMGLAATASQLRHKSMQSTRRYVHPPPEARRKGLQNID